MAALEGGDVCTEAGQLLARKSRIGKKIDLDTI